MSDYVLDLVRKLSPEYNSTTIRFSADEMGAFDRVSRILMDSFDFTMSQSTKDVYSMSIKWGKGNKPTKFCSTTKYLAMKNELADLKKFIDGKPVATSDDVG